MGDDSLLLKSCTHRGAKHELQFECDVQSRIDLVQCEGHQAAGRHMDMWKDGLAHRARLLTSRIKIMSKSTPIFLHLHARAKKNVSRSVGLIYLPSDSLRMTDQSLVCTDQCGETV